MNQDGFLNRSAYGALGALLLAVDLGAPVAASAADAARGQSLFQTRCGMCHAVAGDRSGSGPNLRGVVGRKAASARGFTYTPALMASGLTWTPSALDRFLTAPGQMVPGTIMPIATAAPADRDDLIAYLAMSGK